MRALKFALLALLLATSQLAFADYEEGRRAANNGDYATALKSWKPLAEAGDADAQFGLGRMYARGDGVRQDFKEARRWFLLAAGQGHKDACEKLAIMYDRGDGVTRDSIESAYWKKMAREGMPPSRKSIKTTPTKETVETNTADAIIEPPSRAEIMEPPAVQFYSSSSEESAETVEDSTISPESESPSSSSSAASSSGSLKSRNIIDELMEDTPSNKPNTDTAR